jgi:hypothetical protein
LCNHAGACGIERLQFGLLPGDLPGNLFEIGIQGGQCLDVRRNQLGLLCSKAVVA